MAYSYTEKKRIRKSFAELPTVMDIPYLLSIQVDSYEQFLQEHKKPKARENTGLQAAFSSIFPMDTLISFVSAESYFCVSSWRSDIFPPVSFFCR